MNQEIVRYSGIVETEDDSGGIIVVLDLPTGQKIARLFLKQELTDICADFPGAQVEMVIQKVMENGELRFKSTLKYTGPPITELMKQGIETFSKEEHDFFQVYGLPDSPHKIRRPSDDYLNI